MKPRSLDLLLKCMLARAGLMPGCANIVRVRQDHENRERGRNPKKPKPERKGPS